MGVGGIWLGFEVGVGTGSDGSGDGLLQRVGCGGDLTVRAGDLGAGGGGGDLGAGGGGGEKGAGGRGE